MVGRGVRGARAWSRAGALAAAAAVSVGAMAESPKEHFAAFASVDRDGDKWMTPRDFILSVTPPAIAPMVKNKDIAFGEQSSFNAIDASGDGLVSFSEYVFCLSLLQISPKDLEVAFSMFDVDGNGSIDAEEFTNVLHLVCKRASVDHLDDLDQILDLFFGPRRDKTIQSSAFVDFVMRLQEDVLSLDFALFDQDSNGMITQDDFLHLIFARATQTEQYAKALNGSEEETVSLRQWLDFNHVAKEWRRIEKAHGIFGLTTGIITPVEMERIAQALTASRIVLKRDQFAAFLRAINGSDHDDRAHAFQTTQVLRQVAEYFQLDHTADQAAASRLWRCLKHCWSKKV